MKMQSLRESLSQWRPKAGKLNTLDAIRAFWPTFVGPDVARCAFPVAIDGDALIITTRSGAWSQQLGFLEAKLLPQLQELTEAKNVQRLVFRVGRLRLSPVAAVTKRAPQQIALALTTDPLPSLSLEQLLARLQAQSLERERRLARKNRCHPCGLPLPKGDRCAPCLGRETEARLHAAQRTLREMPWLDAPGVRELVPGLTLEEYALARRSLQRRMEHRLEQLRWHLRKGAQPKAEDRAFATAYTMLITGENPEALCDALLRHALGAPLLDLLYGAPIQPNEERTPSRRTTQTARSC